VPLPFILLAYAPDESIGAEIERARIAKAIAANRPKEIDFIADFLPRLRPAGQEYGRATILNPNHELLEAARIRRSSFSAQVQATECLEWVIHVDSAARRPCPLSPQSLQSARRTRASFACLTRKTNAMKRKPARKPQVLDKKRTGKFSEGSKGPFASDVVMRMCITIHAI
jgi:hypothetical protein